MASRAAMNNKTTNRQFNIITIISMLFIVTLPFSSISHYGLLGNFDSNLSLYPFFLLVGLLVAHPALRKTLMMRSPEARLIRVFLGVMTIVGVLTAFQGWRFSEGGYNTYGQDPIRKSLVTSIVPIMIGVIYIISATIGRTIDRRQIHYAIKTAFWLTLGYIALQVTGWIFTNPLYDLIWPFIEGAKDRGGLPYVEIFNRINGPSSEPAELAKTMMILFLPWVVLPLVGEVSKPQLYLLLLVAFASMSIIGISMLAAGIGFLILSKHVGYRIKISILSLLTIFAFLLPTVIVPLLDTFISRLGNLNEDPSAIIRTNYNLAAIRIILENPIFGVGWSNEIYLFPPLISHISYLWEVQNNITEGISLTARSLILRLLMYTGIPLFFVLMLSILTTLNSGRASGSPQDLSRTKLCFLMILIGGGIDGGIVTSFYIWAASGLALGIQMNTSDP